VNKIISVLILVTATFLSRSAFADPFTYVCTDVSYGTPLTCDELQSSALPGVSREFSLKYPSAKYTIGFQVISNVLPHPDEHVYSVQVSLYRYNMKGSVTYLEYPALQSRMKVFSYLGRISDAERRVAIFLSTQDLAQSLLEDSMAH
jgi:hypothetical protein